MVVLSTVRGMSLLSTLATARVWCSAASQPYDGLLASLAIDFNAARGADLDNSNHGVRSLAA